MQCYFHLEEIERHGSAVRAVVSFTFDQGVVSKELIECKSIKFRKTALDLFLRFLKKYPEVYKRFDLEVCVDDWLLANYLNEKKVEIAVDLGRQIPFSTSYVHPKDNVAAKPLA